MIESGGGLETDPFHMQPPDHSDAVRCIYERRSGCEGDGKKSESFDRGTRDDVRGPRALRVQHKELGKNDDADARSGGEDCGQRFRSDGVRLARPRRVDDERPEVCSYECVIFPEGGDHTECGTVAIHKRKKDAAVEKRGDNVAELPRACAQHSKVGTG